MDILDELKKKKNLTRDDIEGLLESIGGAGEKHQEKIDAVKSLAMFNTQSIPLETTLTSYGNF